MAAILSRIVYPLRRFADLTGLSRMRVFGQILVILFFFLVAIAIGVAVGVMNLYNTQKKSSDIVTGTLKNYTNFMTIRQDIARARQTYLENISGSGFYNTLRDSNIYRVLDQLGMDDNTKKAVEENIQSATVIMDRAPSHENYREFNRHLSMVEQTLEMWSKRALGTNINMLKITRDALEVSTGISVIIAGVGVLFCAALGLAVASSISEPLRDIVSVAKSLADGDLTREIKATGCHETRQVVAGLNQAIGSLRGLVREVDRQAEVLFLASEELRQASVDTGQSAAQVARSMEELAKATTEQTTHISRAVDTVDRLAGLVRKVTDDTMSIAEASENVALSAQEGETATRQIMAGMHQIVDSTAEFAKVIEEMSYASNRINEVTATIASIAEQTTLLALNAEIEAARAGEQGKGFDVIASETAKLSERSKQAAFLIEDITTQMSARIQHTIEVTKEAMSQIEAGQELTNKAGVTFQTIFRALAQNKQQIDSVAAFAKITAKDNEEVLGAISTIAAISEESMASTQDVSAVAEEQSASTEQVATLAYNLYQVAEGLKNAVSAFQVGD